MIGKEQIDVMDNYATQIVSYIDNQQKLVQLKTETIKKLNDVTLVHFQKNQEKIQKINEEFQETLMICMWYAQQLESKLDEHIGKINQISNTIEGMESSVDHLEFILKRIETKLGELEKIKV